MLQETIIIPFTHLHLDRKALGARPEVKIFIEDGKVKVDTGGSDERSFQ
jgi:hypothetical protein